MGMPKKKCEGVQCRAMARKPAFDRDRLEQLARHLLELVGADLTPRNLAAARGALRAYARWRLRMVTLRPRR